MSKNVLYSSIRRSHCTDLSNNIMNTSARKHCHQGQGGVVDWRIFSAKNILCAYHIISWVQNDCYQGGQVDASDSPDQPCRLKSTEMNKKIYVLWNPIKLKIHYSKKNTKTSHSHILKAVTTISNWISLPCHCCLTVLRPARLSTLLFTAGKFTRT